MSLLLKAWYWVGVPVVASATLGAVGWLVAGLFDGDGSRRAAPR